MCGLIFSVLAGALAAEVAVGQLRLLPRCSFQHACLQGAQAATGPSESSL